MHPSIQQRSEGLAALRVRASIAMHIKRVLLIAQENGFKFADTQ